MEVMALAISYKPLWKLLIDRDMTKKALMQETGISKSTVDKMGRGENVSLEIIDRICKQLDCNISEVIEYKHGEER
jgi:putative transcriptional regulator